MTQKEFFSLKKDDVIFCDMCRKDHIVTRVDTSRCPKNCFYIIEGCQGKIYMDDFSGSLCLRLNKNIHSVLKKVSYGFVIDAFSELIGDLE